MFLQIGRCLICRGLRFELFGILLGDLIDDHSEDFNGYISHCQVPCDVLKHYQYGCSVHECRGAKTYGSNTIGVSLIHVVLSTTLWAACPTPQIVEVPTASAMIHTSLTNHR